MPRPAKAKRVCCIPEKRHFHCLDCPDNSKSHALTLEEFETLRLIDYQCFTQEECAAHMGTARTTVQRLYNSARQKMAAFLVEGGDLTVEGGCYQICDGGNPDCENCKKRAVREDS